MPTTEVSPETQINVSVPRQYKVILHNDNKTTFEFVMDLLITLFGKTEFDAFQVTHSVHEEGQGVAGIYPRDIAEQKTEEALRAAQYAGYPLVLTNEPE